MQTRFVNSVKMNRFETFMKSWRCSRIVLAVKICWFKARHKSFVLKI